MNDPYTGILELIKGQKTDEASCKLVIGFVKSVSPLRINAAGLENDEDDVRFIYEIPPELAQGDYVLMLTTDYQIFYVIGKVVQNG